MSPKTGDWKFVLRWQEVALAENIPITEEIKYLEQWTRAQAEVDEVKW